jgi:oligopeptide/dipeptide ABC transporter ATP-binding protein
VPLLQVKGLTKSFVLEKGLFSRGGTVRAVNNISFDLASGECLAIVGESGCGKTTLCRLILCLLLPDKGEVIFEGLDFLKARGQELKNLRLRIQPVFQDPYGSLNSRLTMGQIITEGLIIHGLNEKAELEKRLKNTLKEVGLSFRDIRRFPHEFSGGQRQRISLARAIILKPRLLIADEPVSSLDVSVQAQILNLLYKMEKDFNLSLILVAHDLAMVRQLARRILVMYRGEVLEGGTIEEVYTSPGHPYTILLMESIPVPDPDKRFFPRRTDSLDGGREGECLFYSRCPKAQKICGEKKPETVTLSPSHWVKCHFSA